ncbi:MAG TPA: hypothetical protein VIH26_00720, partial [Anaerolineales bacterium]
MGIAPRSILTPAVRSSSPASPTPLGLPPEHTATPALTPTPGPSPTPTAFGGSEAGIVFHS